MIKLPSEGCLEEEVISVVSMMQNGVRNRRVDLSLIHKSSVRRLGPKEGADTSTERETTAKSGGEMHTHDQLLF